jgi:isopenicillin-N N-acyltransferase like protein
MAAPEIVLGGGKRPPLRSRGFRPALVASALVVVALTVAYIVFRRATTFDLPDGSGKGTLRAEGARLVWDSTAGTSTLERVGDLWVLRAAGPAYELGAAWGRLLGPMTDADADWDGVLAPEARGGWSRFRRDLGLRWRLHELGDTVPEPHRRELAGATSALAARTPTSPAASYQASMWRQAALDLGRVDGDPAAPVGGLTSALAFLHPNAVGKPPPARPGQPPPPPPAPRLVVGRSFGPAAATPPRPVLVSFLRPADAIPFVRIGWSGQLGAVTGVNAEGLFVAVDPAVVEGEGGAVGTPAPLLGRLLLERAHSLDEAIAILGKETPLGAASFLLVDGVRGTWAVVERTPTATAVSRGKPRAAIGDFLASNDFAKDAENSRIKRARGGEGRLARLWELLERPPDVDSAIAALRDRRGSRGVPLPPWSAEAVGNLAAQHTVVVDVSEMILYVNDGIGAAGGFRAFDLRAELRGEAPRSLTNHPPDSEVPAEEAAAVRDALTELARSARFARLGDSSAAVEAAWRALALAPDLALPHRLLGDAARDAGDAPRARAHYRRFLELGPPDEGSADAVRAYLGL